MVHLYSKPLVVPRKLAAVALIPGRMTVFDNGVFQILNCPDGNLRCFDIRLPDVQVVYLFASSAYGTSFRIGDSGIDRPLSDILGILFLLMV